MKIPIFYMQEQSVSSEEYKEHPSLGKPELVVKDWIESFKSDIEIMSFNPISEDDVKLAHLPNWVDLIMTGKSRNGFGTYSKEIADSLLYTSGSFCAAAALTTNNIHRHLPIFTKNRFNRCNCLI